MRREFIPYQILKSQYQIDTNKGFDICLCCPWMIITDGISC